MFTHDDHSLYVIKEIKGIEGYKHLELHFISKKSMHFISCTKIKQFKMFRGKDPTKNLSELISPFCACNNLMINLCCFLSVRKKTGCLVC